MIMKLASEIQLLNLSFLVCLTFYILHTVGHTEFLVVKLSVQYISNRNSISGDAHLECIPNKMRVLE